MANNKNKTKSATSSNDGLHCQDCGRAYDYHCKDCKGVFFLCKCPFFQFSRFLRHDWCENFIPKQ